MKKTNANNQNEKAVNILQGDVIKGIVITCENGMFLALKGEKVICKRKSMTTFFDEMRCKRILKDMR